MGIPRIGILNLMPNKQQTECQFRAVFEATGVHVDLVWLKQTSWKSQHVSQAYLNANYQTYAEAVAVGLDAVIVTGAPIEHLAFEEVAYWSELCLIFDDMAARACPALLICWAAQAGLYHRYKIKKHPTGEKVFGVYDHHLARGHDWGHHGEKVWKMPHSRHTYTQAQDIEGEELLDLVLYSDEAGVALVRDKQYPTYYVTGHFEYDTPALHREYVRDLDKGFAIKPPSGYYRYNQPLASQINDSWSKDAVAFYRHWLVTMVLGDI